MLQVYNTSSLVRAPIQGKPPRIVTFVIYLLLDDILTEVTFTQTGHAMIESHFSSPPGRASRFMVSHGLLIVFGALILFNSEACADVEIKSDDYQDDCDIDISQRENLIDVTWTGDHSTDERCQLILNLAANSPLIHSFGVSHSSGGSFHELLAEQEPTIYLTVGKRDLQKRDGWTIFFDKTPRQPSTTFRSQIEITSVRYAGSGSRASIELDGVQIGPFEGSIRFDLFSGSRLVHIQAIVTSQQDGLAILYDAGMTSHAESPPRLAWIDTNKSLTSVETDSRAAARNISVLHRAVVARRHSASDENQVGSVALFPAPHRFFYPLDFSDNLSNLWYGVHAGEPAQHFGFGMRHEPEGDRRWVPWFNAPPGTRQHLGFFVYLSNGDEQETFAEILRFTRNDRFAKLPGHTTFSSHYHVEHTLDLLQRLAENSEAEVQGSRHQLPSGKSYVVPTALEEPGFVKVFREMGIDVVHLAEFHNGRTPRLDTKTRLAQLELLHAECQRLSDSDLLLLPGEEPNVHFGGHWISFFPKPVYWVLHRGANVPFVQKDPALGKIYHVGQAEDLLRLLKLENGLAWTAHPRIKGSTGFPDAYRRQPFFRSDRFLGAAWKAMPADLSEPRLGWRVLDLLDDMANWGEKKYALGEVDVFKINPDHELYGHMNMNYLRLDRKPDFDEGWGSILEVLQQGRFFVTTGEVLIPAFRVNGHESGETVPTRELEQTAVELDLQWTFPLDYAEIISGDGTQVYRERIDLTDTDAFGQRRINVQPDLKGRTWVRAEVWDIATNGAFTQPVWLEATSN